MKAPIRRLKKDEIIYLAEHQCRHRHTYLDHYSCYTKEKHLDKKIGFFDIESGGSLTADFGYMFSYCIKELNGKTISNCITSDEIKTLKFDKRLVTDLCKDLRKFDTLVVYYGKDFRNRHDFPFSRTRAVKWGLDDFPKWKELKIIDVYDIIKNKFKLARSSMLRACSLFDIGAKTHPINFEVWQGALAGNQKALDYIITHNKEDVVSLEKLWVKVFNYKETITTT